MKKVLKRGYWKWTDENGVRHKVRDTGVDLNENPQFPLELEDVEEDYTDDV